MEIRKKVKIIVCYHKHSFIINNSVYQPLHVGKETSRVNLPFQGDNEGENISDRNCLYCELTGLYWAWKHINADFVGLAHYRRLYSFTSLKDRICDLGERIRYYSYTLIYGLVRPCGNFMYYPLSKTINSESLLRNSIAEFERGIVEYVDKHPEKKIFALHPVKIGNLTNFYFFALAGGREHLRIIKDIVRTDYPNIYPFLEQTLKQNKLFYANMTIMQRDVFNEYCSFIFDVLDKHYNLCLEKGYYQSKEEKGWARLSGYMGEYLTSSFVLYYSSNNKSALKLLSMVKCEF